MTSAQLSLISSPFFKFSPTSYSTENSMQRPRSNLLLRLGCNWTVSSWPPFLSLILFQWPRGRMLISSPALVSWIPFLYQTLWVILCGSVTAVLFVLSSNLFLAFRTTKKPIVPSFSLPLVIRSLTNTKSTLQWDCLKAKRRTKEGSRRSIQIKHTQREKRN